MKISMASWNINGIRAASAKDDFQWFYNNTNDIIAFQETKASPEQIPEEARNKEGYQSFFATSVVKKGYSGTAVFSKMPPLSVEIELPEKTWQGEGRIVHLEFEKFHFFNGYFPNGGEQIKNPDGSFFYKRLEYKMGFFEYFLNYIQSLRKHKPIVVCGDFNIAHKEIDIARPKQNMNSTGFLPVERAFLDRFTEAGYVDTFRHIHGNVKDRYSWWSYKMGARKNNVGWRIDYFFVSDELKDQILDADIEDSVYGSDHCPVNLLLEI